MENLFTILLGVGVVYSVVAFFLGPMLGSGDSGIGSLSPLKPNVIAIFVIVFGGTGILFLRLFPPLTALPLAGLCGLASSFVFYRFLIVPLTKAQGPEAVEIQSLIGHRAKVTETIPQGKFGKITYKVNGSIYTAPAKSEDGKEIARNTSVEIIYIEKHAYFVRSSF